MEDPIPFPSNVQDDTIIPTSASAESAMSLRDQIAAYDDVAREVVTVKEWGDIRLEVRSITLATRNEISRQSRDNKGNTQTVKYYPRVIIASCFDPETGTAVFTMRDIPMLEQKSAGATDRIAKVALRLSGILPDDDDDDDDDGSPAQKDIDDAGKDSSPTQGSA